MGLGAVDDAMLDAQTLRAAGMSRYAGADVGECLATARRVRGTDLSSWYAEWTATASAAEHVAERSLADGCVESARDAFFRAATYHRTAGSMLMAAPVDDRLRESNAAQTRAFRSGARLLDPPAEVVEIPYEGTTLPGYFFAAGRDAAPRATVVLLGGYDGTAEELYFMNGAAALARGYHVLAFDGPGQGAALLQRGLVLRPDWEAVIGPVLDHLLERPEVDAGRVALIGLSLGAFLGPRAAALESRLAAVIADCGSYDLFAGALERMPAALAAGFRERDPDAVAELERVLDGVAAGPTTGWALRRGLLVHGVDSPVAYLDALRDYTLAPYAGRITCPTLVCSAESDHISASAGQLVAALRCETQHLRFTDAEGAGDHCEAGARTLYHARTFDWLDRLLHPRER